MFPAQLQDPRRKIDAVCEYRPGARPTNPVACGLDVESKEAPPLHVQYTQSLHRDLLRGTGFYDTMLAFKGKNLADPEDISAGLAAVDISGRRLFSLYDINLLPKDPAVLEVFLEEVVPSERVRFCRHFGEVPLGLSIVTAVSTSVFAPHT